MDGKKVAGCGCGCLSVFAGLIFLASLGSAVSSSNTSNRDSTVQINPPAQTANENTGESESLNSQPVGAEDAASTENSFEATDAQSNDSPGYVEVGGSFEKDGVKFTVNNADTNYQVKNDKYGLYKPNDGYKYLAVSFTFENTGNKDKYVSIYDFDCYADNTKCEQAFISADTNNFINANISSGRNVSFTTFYEIPINSNTIELEYESDFWRDEKVVIKIQ